MNLKIFEFLTYYNKKCDLAVVTGMSRSIDENVEESEVHETKFNRKFLELMTIYEVSCCDVVYRQWA